MQYKTITLELIQEHPELYDQLRTSRSLLTTMDRYAAELKAGHEAWKRALAARQPQHDPMQIAAGAMELAIEDLRHRLRSASPATAAAPASG